jgi:hypothetical protein
VPELRIRTLSNRVYQRPSHRSAARGPRMQCGWGCGADLTGCNMCAHFTIYAKRPAASGRCGPAQEWRGNARPLDAKRVIKLMTSQGRSVHIGGMATIRPSAAGQVTNKALFCPQAPLVRPTGAPGANNGHGESTDVYRTATSGENGAGNLSDAASHKLWRTAARLPRDASVGRLAAAEKIVYCQR